MTDKTIAMKCPTILVLIILNVTFAGCKKKSIVITESDLLGKWTETQPYLSTTGPYTLQFDSNNKVTETSPYSVTGSYLLLGNNNLQLDCSIPEGPSCVGFRPDTFQITGEASSLTIQQFLPGFSLGTSPPPVYNLHLVKIN